MGPDGAIIVEVGVQEWHDPIAPGIKFGHCDDLRALEQAETELATAADSLTKLAVAEHSKNRAAESSGGLKWERFILYL